MCVEDGLTGNCVDIASSRYKVWNSSPEETTVTYEIYSDLNGKFEKYGLPKTSFVFAESFLYATTDMTMYRYIIRNLMYTIGIVFFVMYLFTDNISR